jgi:hypothetical protein
VLWSVLAVCVLAGKSGALEVKLTVAEPAGAARSGEVVSGGIPLPAGKYKDPAAFSLSGGGTEVPVQVSPIVRYPDGSLHWVLVSFPASLPAGGRTVFTLRDSAGKAKPRGPVVVKEEGDLVEVSNGTVAFSVNRANFNGFESVKFGGKEMFKAAKAGMVASGKGGPGKLTHFSYTYRGPVRTTLYLKGTYGAEAAPTWSMTVSLCAGESAIHIEHSLRNAGKGAKNLDVASPQLRLGVTGGLNPGDAGTSGKGGAYGWQSFSGAADLTVFMRHGGRGNAGHYRAAVADGELAVDLSPAAGPCKIAYGAHKDTAIDLVFGKSPGKEALASPLHARAECAYYSAHDGMGIGRGFGSLADETATYKEMGLKKHDDPKKMPREKPAPGMYVGRFDAHATSECDHLQGLIFGYIRTGQRGFLDRAHAWARYWRTHLLYRSDDWEYGKDGKYRTPKWGSGRICSEGCHFYAAGLFNYALLTGHVDSLEGAFDAAEFANVCWYGPYAGKKPGNNFSTYGSRGFSRCHIVMSRAYDVARDEKWLKYILHYTQMAVRSPNRDPRGFCWANSFSGAGKAQGAARKNPKMQGVAEKEGVKVEGRNCTHPKYGTYTPRGFGTWPAAMMAQANYVSWEALSASDVPEARLTAEDAMDFAIAEAYLGHKYAFNDDRKAVYYYMSIDYPLPDMIPSTGGDAWYTAWWPNALAAGYLLTGDEQLKKTSRKLVWWGLSHGYRMSRRVPDGEAPPYTHVEKNTKGDWMTPMALAIGLAAHPRRDKLPPAAVKDLKAAATGGGKVELTWTAPADAGGGRLARYQVKYAEKPLKDYVDVNYREEFRTVAYWNIATNVLGEPQPAAAGAAQKMTVTAPAGKKLFFAVRSFDDSSNRSKLSNVVAVEVK